MVEYKQQWGAGMEQYSLIDKLLMRNLLNDEERISDDVVCVAWMLGTKCRHWMAASRWNLDKKEKGSPAQPTSSASVFMYFKIGPNNIVIFFGTLNAFQHVIYATDFKPKFLKVSILF